MIGLFGGVFGEVKRRIERGQRRGGEEKVDRGEESREVEGLSFILFCCRIRAIVKKKKKKRV